MPHQRTAGEPPPDDPENESLTDDGGGASDQALTDSDQTSSDSDQTSSDGDQTSADADQSAADWDQAASDRNLAAGVDPHDWAITRDIRLRSTQQRERSARARLDAASVRDDVARRRDLIAITRDQAAEARELELARREAVDARTDDTDDFGAAIILRAAQTRRRAAEFRALAATQRKLAAEDRRAAARDREQAAADRLRALADREALASELAIAETDALTGVRTRAAGLRDLVHEGDRCQEAGIALVAAYIDVIGLKRINDTLGHDAGDDLLNHVVALLRSHLRPQDLIVRLGGDEFLCAISGMPESVVRERFRVISAELAAEPDGRGIRTGFATLAPGESAAQLISRADADLIRGRTAGG